MKGAKANRAELAGRGFTSLSERDDSTRPDFQELWFALARWDWHSVVFVPADTNSAAAVARNLAAVGKQLHQLPITLFIVDHPDDYGSAIEMMRTRRPEDPAESPPVPEREPFPYASAMQIVASAAAFTSSDESSSKRGKVIIAIQPVIDEPLGLAVTQAADLVVLYIDKGHTRISSIQRTIALVGRERIAGCFLDRDGGDPSEPPPGR